MKTMRKIHNIALNTAMVAATVITAGVTLFIVAYVMIRGLPQISLNLLSTSPSYLSGNIGILPDILSTLYILAVSLLITLPLGVGAAIYLTEYAKGTFIAKVIEAGAETLAGIPSVIYGLVGMLVFCEFCGLKTSLIAGALTLVIMNIPTMMRTTQEALRAVPQSYREGAAGLGAGKWRQIRTVVLPNCAGGIITGCLLCAGRILGESAALLFTAGFAHTVHLLPGQELRSPGATLSVALYVYAKEQGRFDIAFAIAAILLILQLIITVAATFIQRHFERKVKSNG